MIALTENGVNTYQKFYNLDVSSNIFLERLGMLYNQLIR